MKVVPFLVLIACAPACLAAGLPRSSPEAQGVSSSGLLAFVDAADKVETMNSVMVVRHGQVVAEGWWAPYNAEAKHSLYSLSKSFTSTAVGLAIAEGKFRLDSPVMSFFPEDVPAEPSNNLKSMRVSDLLRMSTGHQAEPRLSAQDRPWTKSFLDQAVPFKPGTHFLYNTPATYMLSAIVQKTTGMTTLDYLRPRLFGPLGIEGPTWETSPQGISTGGYGLSVRTEDIAKFGQLYLQKGKWEGKQIVPVAWVDAATARQTSNGSNPASDWDQGYGYQFWRSRHGAYRGDGAFGQYCVVLPDQDAVVVITSGVRDMQAVLNLVWDKLLPAFNPAALPADDAARAKLETRLKGLALHPVEDSGPPAKASGKRYAFPANPRKLEAIAIDGDTIVARIDGKESRVPFGRGAWKAGRFGYLGMAEQPAAASGGWSGGDTFTARFCFFETPFIQKITLKFADDTVTFDSESNVGFGATRQKALVGKAE